MSELDFDELDKAVNTLMSDVPKVEPSKTDDIKTLNISSTLTDTSRPSLAQLDSALTEVNRSAIQPVVEQPRPSTTPPPSLATRRSGRFMDVVHPSSNMRSAPRPIMPTSRQGVSVQPDEKLLTEKSEDQSDVDKGFDAVKPESTPETLNSTTTDSLATASADAVPETTENNWPDPLEMSGYGAEPSTNSVVPTQDEETPVSSENASTDESDDELFTIEGLDDTDPQPLNSPFIADAKVEKRPLGGALVEGNVEEPGRAPVLGVLTTDTSAPTDPSDQLPASPGGVESQLPPELQSDLMAIETDGGTSAAPKHAAAPVAVVAEKPATVTTDAPAAASGPTSIPQQYHEEQSTSDQSNGSIYDTDSYHQPLAHPAKTKSGWLWVIWILLLLIVGGGGAVALYFLGII